MVGGDDDERFRPRALKLQANLQRLVESNQIVERARRIAIVATMIDPSAFDLQNEMRVPPEPLQRRVRQLGQGWHCFERFLVVDVIDRVRQMTVRENPQPASLQ